MPKRDQSNIDTMRGTLYTSGRAACFWKHATTLPDAPALTLLDLDGSTKVEAGWRAMAGVTEPQRLLILRCGSHWFRVQLLDVR